MTEKDLRELWKEGFNHAALIQTVDTMSSEEAIVIQVGENLSPTFQSGDLIAFWPDGEHTTLDGLEFDVLIEDLFGFDLDKLLSPKEIKEVKGCFDCFYNHDDWNIFSGSSGRCCGVTREIKDKRSIPQHIIDTKKILAGCPLLKHSIEIKLVNNQVLQQKNVTLWDHILEK